MDFINIKKLTESAVVPKRMTDGSVGYDLSADITGAITIKSGDSHKIGTGIALELPNHTVGLIFARSGLGTKYNLIPANAVGVIDPDYRGEIIVTLTNHGKLDYIVNPSERIAQLVILPVFLPELRVSNTLSETVRDTSGHGSTNLI